MALDAVAPRVLWAKEVPATAVGHASPLTAEVLGVRDRLEVDWVDAALVLARMVENEAIGDRANHKFVRAPVRHAFERPNAEVAVPLDLGRLPLPAAVALGDVLPETLSDRQDGPVQTASE